MWACIALTFGAPAVGAADGFSVHWRGSRDDRSGWPGRRHRELPAGRRKVVLDLERLPGLAPPELPPEDLGDPWRDRRAAIRKLLGEPGAAGQDVIEREGKLLASGPRNLAFHERSTGHERPEQ